MRITIILITIITIIAGILPVNTIVEADDSSSPPVPPNEFYGNVTLNGQPLPSGSTIKAYIDGKLRGSITTTTAGVYGDNLNYLSVSGNESDNGKTITFIVSGVKADETAVWHSMAPPRKLDLHASGSSNSGGGGGTAGRIVAVVFAARCRSRSWLPDQAVIRPPGPGRSSHRNNDRPDGAGPGRRPDKRAG